MFKEIPVNKISIAARKSIYGAGVNDVDYSVHQRVNGKRTICPYYSRWHDMMSRCYGRNLPAYQGCTVSREWLIFSNFRAWMIGQDWSYMELDKDIKNKGNKVYSSDTCLFIPLSLNRLLNTREAARGSLPLGVSWDKVRSKYQVQINYSGRPTYLGRFNDLKKASKAYELARKEKIQRIIDNNVYPLFTVYLSQHL